MIVTYMICFGRSRNGSNTSSGAVYYSYVDNDVHFIFTALPEEAEYIDVLAKISTNDPIYTVLNSDNLMQIPFDHDIISNYSSDSYVSVSAHYQGIDTDMKIVRGDNDTYSTAYFITSPDSRDRYWTQVAENMSGRLSDVKAVVYDKDGNILKESMPFSIRNTGSYWHYGIYYDVVQNEVKVDRSYLSAAEKTANYYIVLAIFFFSCAGVTIFTTVFAISVIKKVILKKLRHIGAG